MENKTTRNNIEDFGSIESLTGLKTLGTLSKLIKVSVEERNTIKCPYFQELWNNYCNGIDISQQKEVRRTIDFLYTKFQNLFGVIEKRFGIHEKEFLGKILERLAHQIDEAGKSGRKFINGTVGSLKSIDKDGNLSIEKIPYWAFGSTNVSLDNINYNVNKEQKTLRELMEEIGEIDEAGEFFLPNSLGVSVMIQFSDGTIIGQKRNNNATLTQYAGLTSSASGAVSILNAEEIGGTELLHTNAVAEVTEELGLKPERLPYFPKINHISGSIQQHLLREVNIDSQSGVIMPVGIIMERKRHNPEIVFTMVLQPEITLKDIKNKWEFADDKWESIDLVGKTPGEIEADIGYYGGSIPKSLRQHPTGLEEFIKTLPNDYNWTGPHLLMSYLAWKKAIEEGLKKTSKYTQSLLDSVENKAPNVSFMEFPNSDGKPSEDRIAINRATGIYGVFDGATSLDGFSYEGISGGAMAAETAKEVFSGLSLTDSLKKGVSQVNEKLNMRMQLLGVDTHDKTKRFGSTASVVHLVGSGLKYINIGDSTIIVEFSDGTTKVIEEESDHDEITLKKWYQLSQEGEINILYHPEIITLLKRVREQSNKSYSILNGETIPDSLIHFGSIENMPGNPIKRVILLTDGFEIPSLPRDSIGRREFIKILATGTDGLQKIKERIFQETEEDSQCIKYPRFKKRDDGSCIVIHFGS